MKSPLQKIIPALLCTAAVLSILSSCECKHKFSEWETEKEPTCTEKGREVRVCAKCETEETKSIDSLGHAETALPHVAPTCTAAGLSEGLFCVRCSTVLLEQQPLAALTHSYTDTVTAEPACEKAGTRQFTCERCAHQYTEPIAALAHVYKETLTTEASCQKPGVRQFTCDLCTHQYTEEVPFTTYNSEQIFAMAKDVVGEILTYSKDGKELSLGSCFVYDPAGLILTNYHVIENAYSADITIGGTKYAVKQIVAYDKTVDAAILKIDAASLSALPLCKEEHSVGKSIFALGSSRGLTDTFSQGIITSAHREVDGILYIQHDAAISNGNSGGPLINQYGEIIGINTWTMRDSQNLNFAISLTELDKLKTDKPLTFSEFYEKECDVFLKLKNHIVSKGKYDAADKEYTLTLGYDYSNDYSSKYTRLAVYDTEDETITLLFLIDSSRVAGFTFDEVNGTYTWVYTDSDDYYMYGTIYGSTFNRNTLLGYSDSNIYYSTLRSSIRELASSMLHALVAKIDTDFKSIGITAKDLGFVNY